ncbi:hypothetical protein T4D_12281 [Trichinella pseudospiralis]|uniref:Uncharacterized protein n=1 Tax=Trichinella pseudospiralis TaxID=6337 RepID=A0A0V1F326_TRIPS|nr:hypothetical protein T4D_6816 [Trichinella pseudospiralis]KRY80537.1 hypothetical protein T4D_894 [Trichinella pseudospiralis]KRY80581.1 hypothetical protein T4D_8373 [Trichinella pseudospiralis]KRY81295.1 hypothetical protein T4D_12281 [Trichinella pseudospiralis]
MLLRHYRVIFLAENDLGGRGYSAKVIGRDVSDMCPVFLTKHQNLAQQFRKAESKRVSAQIQTPNHLFMPRQRNSNQRQEIMELKAFKQYGCLPLFDFDEFKGSFGIRIINLTQLEEERNEYRCNVCLS